MKIYLLFLLPLIIGSIEPLDNLQFDEMDDYISIPTIFDVEITLIPLHSDIKLPSWTGGKFFGETYLSSVQISSGRFWWYDPYAEGTGFRYARDYTEIPWAGMWYIDSSNTWTYLNVYSNSEIYIDGIRAYNFVPLRRALLQWKSRILVTSHFYHPFISLN